MKEIGRSDSYSDAISRGIAHALKGDIDSAITEFTAVIEDPTATAEQKADALFNRGVAYRQKGEPDKAIADYTAVIEDPTAPAEQKAKARVNRGVAYGRKGEPDKEIADYTAVIEDPTAPAEQKAKARINRGVAYGRKGEPDKAITEFTAVIEDPTAPAEQKANARINRGIAYGKKNEPDKAITEFTAVIEDPTAPAEQKAAARVGRSFEYDQKNEHNKAVSDLEAAKEEFVKTGKADRVTFVESILAAIRVPEDQRSKSDKELTASASTVVTAAGEPLSKEQEIQETLAAIKKDEYKKYTKRPSSEFGDSVLAILKGWGSALPLILGGESGCRGGGYFLKFKGKGLIVDPGFDFLTNYHAQGFHAREFHAVIVSHDHSDHNYDLLALDDIRYELWKRAKKKEKNNWKDWLVIDEDTDARLGGKLPTQVSGFRTKYGVDRQTAKDNPQECKDLRTLATPLLPFRIRYFPVKHSNDTPNALGYRIVCFDDGAANPTLTVGFSCDAEYEDYLCEPTQLGNCDILIAHISQPGLDELVDETKLKEGHLGYQGTRQLIRNCKPKLTIVSEFWAGLADVRIRLVDALRRRCSGQAILPGGVGLLVHPLTLKVLCTTCRQWVPHQQIIVASPDVPFGPLKYLCPKCRL